MRRSCQKHSGNHANRFQNLFILLKAKLEISHHKLVENNEIESIKSLVFVLDDLEAKPAVKRPKKEGSEKDSKATIKNLAARASIPKLKLSTSLGIAWRCRFLV